ncbi:MAG: hypothetical protein JRL30_15050 [Deltaproteobacteria bacterium]|nr:hypothetical protein [Deltaproteobacteria bacterium]
MAKAKKNEKNDMMSCPVGRFFSDIEKRFKKKSAFVEHLTRSRIEFLKAMKCLVDEKIEHLEKEGIPRGKRKATRIKVE